MLIESLVCYLISFIIFRESFYKQSVNRVKNGQISAQIQIDKFETQIGVSKPNGTPILGWHFIN